MFKPKVEWTLNELWGGGGATGLSLQSHIQGGGQRVKLRRLSTLLHIAAAGGNVLERHVQWAAVKLPRRAIEKTVHRRTYSFILKDSIDLNRGRQEWKRIRKGGKGGLSPIPFE
jgi:hypothetical protein